MTSQHSAAHRSPSIREELSVAEILDPLTQQHVRRAAEALADEFAGVFSKQTIERNIAEVRRPARRR